MPYHTMDVNHVVTLQDALNQHDNTEANRLRTNELTLLELKLMVRAFLQHLLSPCPMQW